MTYEEFEWHILRMVYERGLERIQPAYIAYALGLPHERATNYLDRAAQAGVLEMEVTDDGHLEYFVPGADPDAPMPDPVWKKGQASPEGAAQQAQTGRHAQLDDEPPREQVERVDRRMAEASDVVDRKQLPAPTDSDVSVQSVAPDEGPTSGADATPGADARVGAASGQLERRSEDRPAPATAPSQSRPDRESTGRSGALSRSARSERSSKVPADPSTPRRQRQPEAADGAVAGADGTVAERSDFPTSIRDHILDREAAADGTLDKTTDMTVVDREASVDANDMPPVVAALENSDRDLPIHIESTEETFSDPSQTIFMRKLRVEGVESEEALREHVHRLFDSLGYQMVETDPDRMRFERGSVTFILALVPLFVLVLPLFVYLFLYCMGRSTIHQEPLELDVQLRRHKDRDDVYDIDLTFIGLHGVVLGAADQRVLNKEVDTLRDELQWALGTG